MIALSPSDRAALEIGRLFMRAHAAEAQVAALQAQLSESTSDAKDELEKPKRRTPPAA